MKQIQICISGITSQRPSFANLLGSITNMMTAVMALTLGFHALWFTAQHERTTEVVTSWLNEAATVFTASLVR